jgi:hypothetical protein
MNVTLFLITAAVSGTTVSPLEGIRGGELVESAFYPSSRVLAELLESGPVERAIEYANSVAHRDPNNLTNSEVIEIITAAKASVDRLRSECQQLSRRFPSHQRRVSVDIICARIERESNERAIQILAMSLIRLLQFLLENGGSRPYADRALYYLTIGDFLRYAIGAGKQGERTVNQAFAAYKMVIDIYPTCPLALMSLNHQALLVKEVHGEGAAINFMNEAIFSAHSIFIDYRSSRDFSAETALEMRKIIDMMEHNLALWKDANEWVVL